MFEKKNVEKMCEYRIYDRGPAQRAPFDFFTKNFLRRLPFESQWPPFLLR